MWRSKHLKRKIIATLVIITSTVWAHAALTTSVPVDGWDILRLATVDEAGENENWRAIKTFPAKLRAASNAFKIDGFVVPVLPEPFLTQFILVEDPDNCPFCGSSGYGPVLDVTMKRPLPDLPEFTRVILSGTLELNEDPDTFQMYRLVDAVLIERP